MTPTDRRQPPSRDLLLLGAFSVVATVGAMALTVLMGWPWYVFIIDENGYTIGHHNPDFRYQDPALRVDSTGHFYGDDMLAATEDGHWVSYVFVNPDTGEEQRKHAWVVLHDGLIFGSGWYEPVEP